MAEVIATELIKVVFKKLADEALKQFVRSQGIHSELKNLKNTLSKIQKLLTDASEKENGDKDIKQWLNRLQDLAYDIDDILDGLATDVMHHELNQESEATTSKVIKKFIPTCCTNISLSSRLHHKLDSIATKLQDLETEKVALGLIVKDEKPKSMSRKNETCLPDACGIVGREGDKKKLLLKLLGGEPCKETFSIVPIVGMGGIGKTTLARLLYNETLVKDHFKLMVWVCISDDFDIFSISKTIFQAVTGVNKDFADLNQLQMALREQFKEKRFLLVLDDVWSENYVDWQNLVNPFHSGAQGSKIIMTTRKEQLLKKLGFDHIDKLESLSQGDALSLFAQHALGVDNFDSHPTLKPQGEGIVKKCGCLPLAIRALGRLLRTVKDEERWEEVLNSEIWDLENRDEIVPALRLSYHDLPACLKQLFAYCSLFPKDFMFDKDDLILLWMAEGFLNLASGSMSQERLGHDYFGQLLSRSFFQQAPNDESLFVMHDLMNDLATFVAGDFFLMFGYQREKEVLAKYRHMSFIRDTYMGYQKFEVIKSTKGLRTFLSIATGLKSYLGSFYLSNKIVVDLLPELQLLRVLCLSGFQISKVPEFIGSLKHLRYLNLSETRIVELPENVCNLCNLQTLIVYKCRELRKLPNSFLKLKNLRHFDIRDTPLLKMPLRIGDLKNLQTLTMVVIGGDQGFKITELKDFVNLQGKITVKGLDKVQSAKHARDANLSLKRLTEVNLEWGDLFDDSRNETLEMEVLNELKPRCDKLEKLTIRCYGGLKFSNWVGDHLFLQLIHVSINECKKCLSLPPLGQLPSLKELYIVGADAVEVVGLEFLGTGAAFRSLEILSFNSLPRWEVWSTSFGIVETVFPCLRELHIELCPNLVDVSLDALPSLEVLKVTTCFDGVLRSLVKAASSITNLEIVNISGLTDEVWRGIIKHLGRVEELKIQACDEIRYLWKSEAEASKGLVNLSKLYVDNCSNLTSLGEKEEDNKGSSQLTSFRTLVILFCNNLECCRCPNSLEVLRICTCTSIKSVSFPTGQKLRSFEINNCEKLMENEFRGEMVNMNMSMLEYVYIRGWPNLKSVIEFGYSFNLTHLTIAECPSIESFPDIQLQNLASLIYLEIRNCPVLDASFPCGFWPPKLRTLWTGGLKKPISQWGTQSFPTSVVHLNLIGEHVSNFTKLSHLLPPSLTELCIVNFKNLESLSIGLQHLTSLQHLYIYTCPNIIDLPEMLLPSLLSLRLSECPKLKEKTYEKGSYYRPLISHIPCIYIDEILQS